MDYRYSRYSIPKERYKPTIQKLRRIAETSTQDEGIERLLFNDGTQITMPAQQQKRGTPMTVKYPTSFLPKYLAKITSGLSKIPRISVGNCYQ